LQTDNQQITFSSNFDRLNRPNQWTLLFEGNLASSGGRPNLTTTSKEQPQAEQEVSMAADGGK
jgi:hypothetical protein